MRRWTGREPTIFAGGARWLDERTQLAAIALSLGVAPFGCHTETAGLEDILSSGPSYVNFPGKRLVSGRVARVDVDFDFPNGPTEARLLIQMDKTGELLIMDPVTLKQCSVGAVASFQSFTKTDGFQQQRPPMIAVLLTQDELGRGNLAFSNWRCRLWSTGLEHAELPMLAPGTKYPIRTTGDMGDALYNVDPWTRTVDPITDHVTSIAFDSGLHSWRTREGSSLVVRDFSLGPIYRIALPVETVPTPCMAFGAGFVCLLPSGVSQISTTGYVPIPGSLDACSLQSADASFYHPQRSHAWFTNQVARSSSFFAPCESRTLQLVRTSELLPRRVGEPGQFETPVVDMQDDSDHLLYVLDRATTILNGPKDTRQTFGPRFIGTLYGARVASEDAAPIAVEKIGDNAIRPDPGSDYQWRRQGDPLSLVDYDGTVGRLLVWHPGGGTTEIAQNVTELDGGLALVDWDGTSGALLLATTDPPILTTLRLSSLGNLRYSRNDRVGVAVAWAGPADELNLIRTSYENRANALGIVPESIDSSVNPGDYALVDSSLLGYRRDVQDGAGTLVLRFLDSQDSFEQKGVSRWQFLSIPPAVLYFVDHGSKAGLWLAPLR